MEITLDRKQYRSLATLVYLGNWLVNAVRPDDEQVQRYNDIEQYVYSFARKGGLEKLISFDKKTGRFITNWENLRHPEVDRYIDDYNEENFWHELVHRLAERDFREQYGAGAVSKMTFEERIEKQAPFIDRYSAEFSKNGTKNLVLKQAGRNKEVVDFLD